MMMLLLRSLLLAALTTQATADADACAAALKDFADPQSKNVAKNALASFASANMAAVAGALATHQGSRRKVTLRM